MTRNAKNTGLFSLTALSLGASIAGAVAQEAVTVHVDEELVGPFPAHHLCVADQIRKILGPKAEFAYANNRYVSAFVEDENYRSVDVTLDGNHVTSLSVGAADDLKPEGAHSSSYSYTGYANVQYGNIGGFVEQREFGERVQPGAQGFLKEADAALRKCALTM